MAVYRIPCPNCRKDLKVKDRSLLGRKAKCPACEHRFVLAAPPDDDEPATAGAALAETAEYRAEDLHGSPASPPQTETDPVGVIPAIETASAGGVGRLKELQRRNRKRRNTTLIAGAVCVVLLGGAYLLLRPHLAAEAPADAANDPLASPVAENDSDPPPPPSDDLAGPTDGEPITLRMVPSGARLIVNLRPAQLWSDDPRMAELRASLTQDVTGWLEEQLRSVCRHEPAQIEEVLFAWILGARGTEPQLAAVVHLVEEARMSDLLDEFGKEALDEFAQRKVYLKGEHATLIRDTKTFAVAPREFGAELAEWVEVPNENTSNDILDLLQNTDRERLLTVVFEPADVPRHLDSLVSEAARPVLAGVADWFETEAGAVAVAWSLHTGDEFHSELLVRGPRTASPRTVEERLTRQLEEVPQTMVDLVRRMQPQRSGFRKLIGRFPAMLEVSRRASVTGSAGRAVRLTTVMPPKAGPNLALGAVLTWDESTRTDFSADAPLLASAASTLPKTVIERMQLPVDAEFNRMPLQEALDYIAGEIQVAVEIDGDALKDAGFTKNMAQTFNLGKVPASEVLAYVVGQYDEPGKKMVLVVDEGRQTLIVLTKKFADQRGLTVHDFGS